MTDPCALHPEQEKPCPTCGLARVRAALAIAPRLAVDPSEHDPDPTRQRALDRARKEHR